MEQHKRRKKWFIGLSLLIVFIFMSFKPLLAKPPEEAALNVTQQTSLNEVPLAAGWNLVSLPNAPASSDPAAVFAAISSEHSITYGFDGCAAGEQWQVYDPAGLSGTNDFTAVDHTTGFWVETTAATVLPADGTQPPTSTIELCAGWNLIGLPLAQARPVRSALASIEGKYTQVFGFDPADPLNPWQGYDATAPNWSNTLTEMEPGRGYWVYATEDTTLLAANEGPAPLVEITAPAATNDELPTVTTFTEVFGVINSNLLESWTLAYRPIEGEEWTTIAAGNTPLYDELMGTFDPTLLINGLHELQLTAVDFQGQSSADTEVILVDGQQKIGHFSLSFVDVSVPVLGIPIDIIRTYDSRDKQQGDFGVGWTLSTRQGVRVQENAVLGLNWQVVPQGSFVHCLKAVGPHIVAVVIDDSVYRFRATIENECRAFTDPFGLEFITFEALPGTDASLESVTSNLALFANGQLITDDGNGLPVDFSEYRFTLPSGVEMDIEQGFGVTRMEEPNGNMLTIDENGITHQPSGVGIIFERDAQDRIFRITDPLNYTVEYGYDANGDLISVTNQVSETTGFTYLPDHYLNTIVNPDGVEIAAVDYDEDGRVASTCDFENNCNLVNYELENNREVITDATGRSTTLVYDNRGNVTEVSDNAGNTTYYAYDEQNNPINVTDPNGNVAHYTYDENGNMLTSTELYDPADPSTIFSTTYTYNARGQVTSVNAPGEAQTVYGYDNNGNLTSISDREDNLIIGYTYGSGGIVLAETGPFGTTHYGDFDLMGNPQTITNTFGHVMTATYDLMGNVETTVVDDEVVHYTYDGLGRSSQITDNTGFDLQYDYVYGGEFWAGVESSSAGNFGKILAPNGRLEGWNLVDGTQLLFDYDPAGRLQSETNPSGLVTAYQYDTVGRLSQVEFPTGASQLYEYDAGGRITQFTNALGDTVTTSYLPDGRTDVFTDTLGHVWDYSYTLTSTTLTDPLQRDHTIYYSPEGLPVTYVNPDGSSVSLEYLLSSPMLDANQYPTRIVDEAGHERLYTYNQLGLLQTATDLAGEVYTYHYDENSVLVSITNPLSETVMTFTSDENGNLATVTYPDGGTREITSTINGDPLTVTHPSGAAVSYTYDESGNPTSLTASTGENYSFSYDESSRLSQTVDSTGATYYSYDEFGLLKGIDYPNGMQIRYGYNLLGQVITVTTQLSPTAPAQLTSYSYDARGNLVSITDPLNGVTTIDYDAVGRPLTRTLPNGVTTQYSYNDRDQVISVVHKDSNNTVLSSITYERTGIGEPSKITREDGSYVVLTYDEALRLISESYYDSNDASLGSIEYEYDASGSRTVITNTTGVYSYAYEPGSLLTAVSGPAGNETYQHDMDGRLTLIARDGLTLTADYDSHDHLTTISGVNGSDTINYIYDAMGRRVKAVDAAGERNFLVAPMANSSLESPHLIMDENGALIAGYVYANGEPLMRFDSNGEPVYYLSDAMGSIVSLANDTGNSMATFHYDSFGNMRATSGTSSTAELGGDFRFHGTWLETETNLYHFRARDYDAQTGRFLSRDAANPIFERPETFNPYAYGLANPHVYRDPSGFFTLISLNVSQTIQSGLQTLAKTALKRYIKSAIKDGVHGLLQSAISRLFSSMLGFANSSALGKYDYGLPKGSPLPKPGEAFEQEVSELVCPILDQTSFAKYLWFEIPMDRHTGRPLSDGYSCGFDDEDLEINKKINDSLGSPPNPDFVISAYAPHRLKANKHMSGVPASMVDPYSFKSYLVGDFKLTVATAGKKWNDDLARPTTPGQFRTMINHAKNFEYYPVMIIISWKFGTNGQAEAARLVSQIGRRGVVPIIIVIKD